MLLKSISNGLLIDKSLDKNVSKMEEHASTPMLLDQRYTIDHVPEITRFEIELEKDTILLDHAEGHLTGKVVVELARPLKKILGIDLRFVGGIICKKDDNEVFLLI